MALCEPLSAFPCLRASKRATCVRQRPVRSVFCLAVDGSPCWNGVTHDPAHPYRNSIPTALHHGASAASLPGAQSKPACVSHCNAHTCTRTHPPIIHSNANVFDLRLLAVSLPVAQSKWAWWCAWWMGTPSSQTAGRTGALAAPVLSSRGACVGATSQSGVTRGVWGRGECTNGSRRLWALQHHHILFLPHH